MAQSANQNRRGRNGLRNVLAGLIGSLCFLANAFSAQPQGGASTHPAPRGAVINPSQFVPTQTAAALEQYDKALRQLPDSVDMLFSKAQVLLWAGQPEAARPLLRRARAVAPDNQAVWRLQLEMLTGLGLAKQSEDLLKEARRKFPGSQWSLPPARGAQGFADLGGRIVGWGGGSTQKNRRLTGGRHACEPIRGWWLMETVGYETSRFPLASVVSRSDVNASLMRGALAQRCGEFPLARQFGPATATVFAAPGNVVVTPLKSADTVVRFDKEPAPYDPSLPEVPAAPVLGGKPGGGPKTPAVADSARPAEKVSGADGSWGLAPIRWGASAGVQVTRTSRAGGAQSTDLMEVMNVRGATYIYAPWLAQVSGSLGLTTNQGRSSGGEVQQGSGGDSRMKNNGVTGSGSLAMFSSSRFPFLANFDVSDSRNSSELTSTAYTNTRVGIRQTYSPEEGGYNVTGGFNSSTVNFATQGTDTVNAIYTDFGRHTEDQTLGANFNYSQSVRDLTGDNSRLLNVNTRHSYRLFENISINSLATISDNTLNTTGGAFGVGKTHGRYIQTNSTASWRPGEDEDGNEIPLYVNGGLRMLNAQTQSGDVTTAAQSVGGNASATYRYDENLALTTSGVVTRAATNGGNSQLLALFGGGANYVGDPLTFGNFSYFWNVGANGNQQTGGKEGSTHTLAGQFGHSLFRPLEINEKSSLNFTLGQSVAETFSGLLGSTMVLSHNAGTTYRAAFGESLSGTASLNLNDTATSGAASSGRFTNLNLLLNGQAQISRHSTASINMTFQQMVTDNTIAQASLPSAGIEAFSSQSQNRSLNIFGSATYQHQRVFGIPRLRYYANLMANTLASSRDDRLAGNVSASVDSSTYTFDNRIDYRIGRLDLQAKGTLTELAGKKNAMIFFKVTREFGNY